MTHEDINMILIHLDGFVLCNFYYEIMFFFFFSFFLTFATVAKQYFYVNKRHNRSRKDRNETNCVIKLNETHYYYNECSLLLFIHSR